MNFARKIKNIIVGNKKFLKSFIFLINTPVIGNIYDFFYFKIAKKRIAESNLVLLIEPNNICNLKCIMCPYQRMKRKKETMSMSLFKSIVDQASELECENICLQQYNEPFIDKFIFERIKYINSKGIKTLIYSNGTLLNKEMREKILDAQPTTIRFSIDGVTKKTYESIRIGAKYEEVIENVQNLYKERNKRGQKFPGIEVYFTVLEKNKKEAEKFLEFWKDKCDFATLYPADSRQDGSFSAISYKNKKPYPCFNQKYIIVLSNGKVALCCVDVDGDIELGDLKKQKLKDILNSKKFREIYQSQMERRCNLKICKNCSKFYIDSALKWWVI